jgi:hypothetical protein
MSTTRSCRDGAGPRSRHRMSALVLPAPAGVRATAGEREEDDDPPRHHPATNEGMPLPRDGERDPDRLSRTTPREPALAVARGDTDRPSASRYQRGLRSRSGDRLERSAARCGGGAVDEQPVDDRARARHVRAERAETPELPREVRTRGRSAGASARSRGSRAGDRGSSARAIVVASSRRAVERRVDVRRRRLVAPSGARAGRRSPRQRRPASVVPSPSRAAALRARKNGTSAPSAARRS